MSQKLSSMGKSSIPESSSEPTSGNFQSRSEALQVELLGMQRGHTLGKKLLDQIQINNNNRMNCIEDVTAELSSEQPNLELPTARNRMLE